MCHVSSQPYLTFFFFNDTATTEIYPLSLHDALPILCRFVTPETEAEFVNWAKRTTVARVRDKANLENRRPEKEASDIDKSRDRKSTRLNSSHANISYAVFCLKKKKKKITKLVPCATR